MDSSRGSAFLEPRKEEARVLSALVVDKRPTTANASPGSQTTGVDGRETCGRTRGCTTSPSVRGTRIAVTVPLITSARIGAGRPSRSLESIPPANTSQVFVWRSDPWGDHPLAARVTADERCAANEEDLHRREKASSFLKEASWSRVGALSGRRLSRRGD